MRRAGFPDANDNNTIERLFITSESENAAEFASSTELKVRDVSILRLPYTHLVNRAVSLLL